MARPNLSSTCAGDKLFQIKFSTAKFGKQKFRRKPAAEFAFGDPQHEFRRRSLFPGHGTRGNSAVCASHVKGQHLPFYKVNRTQKQLPQPSGTMRIFEVINGVWNKERHLQQGACSACFGIRSNVFSINGPALLSSLMALRSRLTHTHTHTRTKDLCFPHWNAPCKAPYAAAPLRTPRTVSLHSTVSP